MAKADEKYTASPPPPYELEDLWLNAFAQLPDARPLATLLRNYSTPMPPGIRDLLAELLNSGEPDFGGGRLTYTPTNTIRRVVDEWLPLVVGYHAEAGRRKAGGEGDPSQKAAEIVGKKNKRRGRTIYRKVRAWRDLVSRLYGLPPGSNRRRPY